MTIVTPNLSSQPELRILSMKEVCKITGFSRTHIYRLEAKGAFPRRRKLGLSKIGFINHEIDEWVANLDKPALVDFAA